MRTFNRAFIDFVEEESNRQQKLNGQMSKVYYHRFYLAQESANRLVYCRDTAGKNKLKAVTRLVDSFVSLMGEYNKHIRYVEPRDYNPNFIAHVRDEADRQDSVIIPQRKDDYYEEAIHKLKTYVELRERDQKKDRNLLIQAATSIIKQYNRLNGLV